MVYIYKYTHTAQDIYYNNTKFIIKTHQIYNKIKFYERREQSLKKFSANICVSQFQPFE